MRKILFISLILIMGSCFSSRKPVSVVKHSYPEITADPDVLDTSVFKNRRPDTIVRNGKHIRITSDINGYSEEDKDGNLIKDYSRFNGKQLSIDGDDYSDNLIFGIHKEYSIHGALLVKGGRCWYGFMYGKWYYYDEKGTLIKTVDRDKGYNFTADDILKFCSEHSIPMERKIFGPKTIIYKTKTDDGKPAWSIIYNEIDLFNLIWLQIDGNSGKIIKRNVSAMPME